jgi:hypothetical protein
LETNYFLNNVGIHFYSNGLQANVWTLLLRAENAVGENEGAGWETLGCIGGPFGNERCFVQSCMDVSSSFKKYPADPRTLMDIEKARSYQVNVLGGQQIGMGMWITYHSITFTASGTLSGYADADGAGLTVKLYRTDTGEYLGSATTTTGGAYSFTWYDDTITLFAEIREDSTHVGRSDNAAAS